MARRVRFDGSGASGSPLKISVAGVDAIAAAFNDCIFDGNQPPLRLYATGFTAVTGITFNERLLGKNFSEGSAVPIFTPPAGTSPVFLVAWRLNDALGRLETPSSQGSNNSIVGGGGGGVCGSFFCPIAFSVGAPALPDNLPNVTLVNFCIFKNCN
jgi:hypothetical protein